MIRGAKLLVLEDRTTGQCALGRAAAGVALRPISVLVVFAALCGIFAMILDPWTLSWGSTPQEQAMSLPGDTAPASAYYTRAITIDQPPSTVWPWLLQIGQDRAAFYSNDWLENLFGADMHNADVLRPDWQERAIGDKVPMAGIAEQELVGPSTPLTVRLLEPDRAIGDVPGRFVLVPKGHSATRLLLREEVAGAMRDGLMWVIWDPIHFIMERRLLEGIKERVEGQPFVPPVV